MQCVNPRSTFRPCLPPHSQMRNLHLALMLSQGTPMLLIGVWCHASLPSCLAAASALAGCRTRCAGRFVHSMPAPWTCLALGSCCQPNSKPEPPKMHPTPPLPRPQATSMGRRGRATTTITGMTPSSRTTTGTRLTRPRPTAGSGAAWLWLFLVALPWLVVVPPN